MGRNPLVTWWIAGAIAAIAIGWFAALIHASGHAPIGLTSLAVGVVLGASLSALAASQRLTELRPLILGTVALTFITVGAEHAWLYRDYCGQWHEARAKSPTVALFRPESPPSPREYFSAEARTRAVLWIADAAMILVAAVGMVIVLESKRK